MSGTKSFPADNVKLHIASAADAPSGTMTVLMRTNRYYTDGSLLQTGVQYTVTKEWGQDALSRNWCEDVADVFPETETPSGLTAAQITATAALVSEAGKPFDTLTAPLQQVTITGAISTTAALTATATGTYRKARIAWNNNGASGTAKLRIAANTDNDVHGLVAGQSAKRRDYELTMGDAVTLVCAEPITRLTFSADGSITSGTHSIQVTFGS